MNIAIVGGGPASVRLIDIVEGYIFHEIHPRILAVADPDQNAPGIAKAKAMGLTVTDSYHDFFARHDIDLIVELTDDMAVYNDILRRKRPDVRAISTRTARLFWEIARIRAQEQKTQAQLGKTRTIYETAIHKMIQEDVLVIGRDYRIIDVNDTLLNKLGLPREEVIGRTCHEVTHHQHRPCSGKDHPCPLKETLETLQPSKTTHVHLDKEDRKIHYSIHTYPMIENERLIGVIEISRDITHDINMEKTVMRQEKLAAIGRLSAGVAHEINNPLTTILTSAMLIQEDTSREDPIYEELSTIANEALRCRRIVQSLLDFARQKATDKRPQDLNETVRQSVLLTQKQAAFSNVSFDSRYDQTLPPVLMDRNQMQQALINLILNAVEATGAGGRIELTTRFDGPRGHAYVHIQDTGQGIAPEDMDRVFDPFFTTKESGTGLGLAITHGIVEQHGGAIDVCSLQGKGTEFTIQLPAGNSLCQEAP